ncbi:ABC transporter ATP-binding protein [Phenylobacterium sp.]|uniref:ABC transporter ATP-binding protein n=1 Tax=Phenylobacterium sp. TaxID=1871053 RepID=UPI003BA9C93C
MSTLGAIDIAVSIGGVSIIGGLTLSFKPGAVTALVGPNGAGKSTLLTCLAGLRRPERGETRLGGEPLLSMAPRERARHVALLEQTPEIVWAVDVRTLVGLGRTPFLGARGLTTEDREAVDDAMRQAEVAVFADRPVTSLSGGERARVLIARALAGRPQWLLADEPLSGLDPGHQLDAVALFRALASRGAGVIVTLHDLTLAARMADRVLVLARGAVLADGAPRDALRPEVLAQAYGVEARLAEGAAGALIEVVGRIG